MFEDAYEYTSPTGERSNPIYYISPVESQGADGEGDRWITSPTGTAVLVLLCVFGMPLLSAMAVFAAYRLIQWIKLVPLSSISILCISNFVFRSRKPVAVDWEARRNWRKAIRKAMLVSRLTTAKAIDPR